MSDSVRPHRGQPTRLPRPWDSPGKNTGGGCHFLLQCVKVKSLSRVQLSATPWTAAHQAPPPMGFSRQEYWSGVPLPSPTLRASQGDLERESISPCTPASSLLSRIHPPLPSLLPPHLASCHKHGGTRASSLTQ